MHTCVCFGRRVLRAPTCLMVLNTSVDSAFLPADITCMWASSLQGKPLQQNACTKTNMTISAVQMSILLWSDLQEMRARSQPPINARSTITLSLKEGKRIRMYEFARMSTVPLHFLHDWIVVAELKNHRFKPLRPHRPHINDDLPIACCMIVQS